MSYINIITTIKAINMTTEITIEKNIPLPPPSNYSGPVLKKLLELDVGDSFEISNFASGSITHLRKKHPELKFTRRKNKETGMVRIWRVK